MDIYDHIIKKAKELGATLAGFTDTDSLQTSPSYEAFDHFNLPENARSVLVLALVHKQDEPELDWWGMKGGTSGNQKMQDFSEELADWMKQTHGINSEILQYAVEPGGTFLKDAAVLAGLGCIGKNNLLITPEYGPRVRLRAIALEVGPAITGAERFSPCDACKNQCWQACPQNAFSDGYYNRAACSIQMKEDEAKKIVTRQDSVQTIKIKYCRACELSCPAGRKK